MACHRDGFTFFLTIAKAWKVIKWNGSSHGYLDLLTGVIYEKANRSGIA
jgi:hypothetical protein